MQVGDVRFQRPRTCRPTMVILCQRPADHLPLERLCCFTQVVMLWDLRNNFRRRCYWRFILQGKMLRLQHHFIPCHGRPCQNHRAVNGMFQLAHIPGRA